MPPICVTVTGRDVGELRQKRDEAAHADLVELRLDGLDTPDPAAALAGRTRPVVVTCRPTWEGGRFAGSEEERRRILTAALELGADFVDVEAAATFAPELVALGEGRGIVLSTHLFERPPTDLRERYAALCASRAEVVKLAVQVERLSDTLPLFALADESPERDHVLIGMGAAGTCSRVLSARLRNRWTYAGDGVAPGQLPAERLVSEFTIQRVRPGAALYGVVGNPVSHSLSPAMHNAGFAALELDAAYLPLAAADPDDFVRFARTMTLRGASITAPFKVALMSAVEKLDPVSIRVGAINTLVVRDGRWLGYNTDVEGFLAPLAGRIRLKGIRATVLGAGGAARAVAVALDEQGALVTVSARRAEAARELAHAVGVRAGSFPPPRGTWDVLVNATSAATATELVNPIAGTPLDGEIVFDLVYRPARTPLLAAAEAEGCLTIGGLEMLIAQAERQFELWTGERPPANLFRSSALRAAALPEPAAIAPGAS